MAIAEPCCPDSMTKFLLDVFHDTSTSSMFYTTDMMVLIDIVARQLTDLSQGDEVRQREGEREREYCFYPNKMQDLISARKCVF